MSSVSEVTAQPFDIKVSQLLDGLKDRLVALHEEELKDLRSETGSAISRPAGLMPISPISARAPFGTTLGPMECPELFTDKLPATPPPCKSAAGDEHQSSSPHSLVTEHVPSPARQALRRAATGTITASTQKDSPAPPSSRNTKPAPPKETPTAAASLRRPTNNDELDKDHTGSGPPSNGPWFRRPSTLNSLRDSLGQHGGFAVPSSPESGVTEGWRQQLVSSKGICTTQKPRCFGCMRLPGKTPITPLSERRKRQVIQERSLLWQITQSGEYEMVRAVLIILDVIVLVWETEYASQVAISKAQASMGIPDATFFVAFADMMCIAFLCDLMLHVSTARANYFRVQKGWGCFNILVIFSYILQIIGFHGFRHQRSYSTFRVVTSQFSMVRIVRLLQVVQVTRDVRKHPFFRELRIMVYSLLSAIKPLAWTSVMLFGILVIFGVSFTEGCLAYLVRNNAMAQESTVMLRRDFGTVSGSVLSLYKAMSGGADWADVFESLTPLDFSYKALFILFITFAIIAVLNVTTAVFVESAMQKSQNDREFLIQTEINQKREFLTTMEKIFEELDEDGSGEVDLGELQRHMKDPMVGAYFSGLGVDVSQVHRLFTLLDQDRSNRIDKAEFMFGCLRLQGEAKSLDIAILQADIRRVGQDVKNVVRSLVSALASLPDETHGSHGPGPGERTVRMEEMHKLLLRELRQMRLASGSRISEDSTLV